MRLDRTERLKWGQEDEERERRGQRGWQRSGVKSRQKPETRKRKDFHVSLWHTSTINEKGKLLIRKVFYSPCWLKYLQSPEIRETLWVPLQTAITLKAGISTAILLQYYFSHEWTWMLQWGLEGYRWDQEVAHKTILTLGVVSHPVRACVHLWESSPCRPCCCTSTRCEGPWAASGAAQLQNWAHQCYMKIHITHCAQ